MDLDLIIRKKEIQRDLRILSNDRRNLEKICKAIEPEGYSLDKFRCLIESRLEKKQRDMIELNKMITKTLKN